MKKETRNAKADSIYERGHVWSRTDGRVIPHALGALGVHSVGSLTSRAGELRSAPTQRARQTDARHTGSGLRAQLPGRWPQTDEQLVGHALVVPKKLSGRSVSVLEANEAGRAGGGRDGPLTHLLACLLQASAGFVR